MEPLKPISSSASTKDLKLSDFQQWVLAYFVKDPEAIMTEEEIMDSMCLTALLDLDIDNTGSSLKELQKYGLVDYQHDKTSTKLNGQGHLISYKVRDGFIGTLKGRLYFKQKIIIPLVLAKRDDKIRQVVTFLNDNYGEHSLATEIKNSFAIKDQKEYVKKLASIAIDQFVPFMNILGHIQTRFFGNM